MSWEAWFAATLLGDAESSMQLAGAAKPVTTARVTSLPLREYI